ncbi:MAG TPA: type I-C CRISPR-associated protein Cas7/Csd2, partial [candidate division Zixibacteria bacterium]|nr:type I-C CRISPR-associated protein Cas7/Csd2 [candidate division Zixibacteria bacterium]
GIVTDVCIKRKIRDYVLTKYGNLPPHRIYILNNAVLSDFHREGCKTLGIEPPKEGKQTGTDVEKLQNWLCQNFYDIRTFGAVMSIKPSAGIVRGPVQMTFAKSAEPIVPMEITITRIAVASEEERKAEKEHMMGRKYIVPYALYRTEGFISAKLAEKTGFSEEDLALLWEALANMFDHDRSAARGKMTPRKLVVFRHDSPIGNAPAHKLLDMVKINPVHGDNPPRRFEDYEVIVPTQADMPAGVTVEEKF